MLYKLILKPIFFLLPPETAHNFVIKLLKFKFLASVVSFFCFKKQKSQSIKLKNLEFENPIGLAAGFDKNAEALQGLSMLNFGFIEIGTVTPKPQAGNPKPRLFRLKKDLALLNRMGFNNLGVEKIKENLKNRPQNIILGINIGKNKTTPLQEAYKDYLFAFKELFDFADYFTINVSSPNTPNLRKLQQKAFLEKILAEIQKENQAKNKPKPIFLKIAPDLTFEQIEEILELVEKYKIDGIIATNTTINKKNLKSYKQSMGDGGISGKPLKEKSTEIIKFIRKKNNNIIIIGVGGIFDKNDVQQKIKVGANLIQIYTSFIYEGPCIVKKLL